MTVSTMVRIHGWHSRNEYERKKAKAYILGATLGDGTIATNRTTPNGKTMLRVKSEIFARSYAGALSLLGIHSHTWRLSSGLWCTLVTNFRLGNWIKSLTPSKIYSWLPRKEFKRAFLRGIYEAEGSITRQKNSPSLRISNTDPDLIKLIVQMVSDLGFQTSVYTQQPGGFGKKPLMHVSVRGGNSYVKKFLTELNPCIRRWQYG